MSLQGGYSGLEIGPFFRSKTLIFLDFILQLLDSEAYLLNVCTLSSESTPELLTIDLHVFSYHIESWKGKKAEYIELTE